MGKAKVMLNIGCGREYRDGWINVDNQQMYNGDFKVDMEEDFFTLKWKKNSVDIILANHIAQYIAPPQMKKLLKRWHGWLKEGGVIAFEAGNIMSVCKKILEAETIGDIQGKDGVMQLYGIDDNIWNKWAWCPETMTVMMHEAGFKKLKVGKGFYHNNPDRDFVIQGTK